MGHLFRVTVAVVAGAALVMPVAAHAQDRSAVSGLWNLSVVSPDGEAAASLAVIEQDGRLSGILSSPRGQVPVEGSQTPDAVTIRFSVMYEGSPLPITLTATPSGDAMSGQADYGGQASGTWKANRISPTGISGAWTFAADAGDGPIAGALTLLDENGKVSGRLVVRSRGVDGVVAGTHADGVLKLKADATADGSPVTIDMPGKVEGTSSLSGTFSVADIFGRWTATRP